MRGKFKNQIFQLHFLLFSDSFKHLFNLVRPLCTSCKYANENPTLNGEHLLIRCVAMGEYLIIFQTKF